MLEIPWPQKKIIHFPLIPVFIPYAGCPKRCIFCAQHLQSGSQEKSAISVLSRLEKELTLRKNTQDCAPELGFFGGTFTSFAKEDLLLCLDFVEKHKVLGHIRGARCSTRPDALDTNILKKMHKAGFTTIELGIQSFSDSALFKAQRQYTEEKARLACQKVQDLGFTLGVQLLPGMPGVDTAIFLEDVQKALHLGAHFMRFYPCQVIADTELAALWQKGAYTPWTLEQSITALSAAWLQCHLAHVPVIRMGLAPETDLDIHILAGPKHPALGNIIQSTALHNYITTAMQKNIHDPITRLRLPTSCQGYFWGHKQKYTSAWKKLGIHKKNVLWHHKETIFFET